MPTLEEHARKRDVKGMFITALLTALTFVVGLFWNDAIRSAIETVIPVQERVSAKFMAAFIVTVLVVLVAWTIMKTDEFHEATAKRVQQKRAALQRAKKR